MFTQSRPDLDLVVAHSSCRDARPVKTPDGRKSIQFSCRCLTQIITAGTFITSETNGCTVDGGVSYTGT